MTGSGLPRSAGLALLPVPQPWAPGLLEARGPAAGGLGEVRARQGAALALLPSKGQLGLEPGVPVEARSLFQLGLGRGASQPLARGARVWLGPAKEG